MLARRRRLVPGRLPQPARRPVPARRRRRRRARRDDRGRLPAARSTSRTCCRRRRSSAARSRSWPRTRSAARPAAARGGATLVLAGVTVASFFTAVQTFVQQQHSDTLQEVYSWILGRLPSSGWRDVVILLPYVVVATVGILLHRRLLDVLSVGDEEAASLGVQRRPGAARGRRLRDGRHGGGGRGQRADRLRRDHRPARDPARRRAELPAAAAAVGARRRRLPRARGRDRAHGALAGRAADRRRHRVLRRAVLRRRAPHLAADGVV